MASRFLWQNWCQLANTTVTASSEEVSYPDNWLKDTLRSKAWRSKTGWTIVENFNDKLNFLEGSTFHQTATLTPGTYTSGTSMAAQIQLQMNAVTELSCEAYAVTYSALTYKFTIARNTTGYPLGLEFSGGVNSTATPAADIGFNPSSDLLSSSSGTDSYISTAITHQSRHFIHFDFSSAKDVHAAILHYSNIPTSAVVKIQGNTADTWNAPPLSTTMTMGDVHVSWMTSVSAYRHWRFLIDNTKNSAGYTYLGVPFLGEYLEPSPGISHRFSEDWIELSEVGFSDQGAQFQNEKDRGRHYKIVFPGLTDTEKNKIKQMANFVRVGRPFFFSLDPSSDPDDAVYVINLKGINIQNVSASYWQASMDLEEALG